jgi:sortase family protein
MTADRPASCSRRLLWPILATAAGLLIAVGAPVGWSLTDHPTGTHQIKPGGTVRLADNATPALSAPSTPSKPSTVAASPSGSSTPSQNPGIPISATGGNILPAPSATPAPVRISISALTINAPVVAEGIDSTGEMEIPTNIHTIGWYQWGSAPGATAGSIVMVGHVDSAQQGLGAFFYLKTLTAGALITVTTADNKTWNYRVLAREEFPKTNVPLAAIFDQAGPPRLILATCGGAFDHSTKSYYDNIVVTALPA